jgi:predicted Zn-dependent peptidase
MMMRPILSKISLILVFLMLYAGNLYAFDLEEKIIKTKLDNGLTVLMLERHLSPTVSLYIRYRVGAVDEESGETGAAHFLEHMMFKGTTTIGTNDYEAEIKILEKIEKAGHLLDREKTKGPKADPKVIEQLAETLKKLQDEHKKYFIPNEIDRLYSQNGGLDMNASTGQDVTTYHISLPANKIELWARIESDRMLNPVFREFYTERDVVMEERRQRIESNPGGKLYEQFMKTAYKKHPYGIPILGWMEDIMNLNHDVLNKILRKYKAPENMVIAVVGDINPGHTLDIIKKYFGRFPASGEIKSSLPAEPAQSEERRVEVEFDAASMMIIGFHKPNAPAFDDYVFDVLETILTKGRTSRLYHQMVTDLQIAKSISAINGLPGIRYPNLFAIYAEPRHPHTNADLEKIILQEIERIKTETLPEEELVKAKNQIKMDYIQSLNANSKIASILSYYELLLGDHRYFSNYPDQIEKVTARDIQRIAKIYLTTNNRTTAVLEREVR